MSDCLPRRSPTISRIALLAVLIVSSFVASAAPDPAKVRNLDDLASYAVGGDAKLAPLVQKHGFTPREFLLANLALMNAALAVQARSDPNLAKTIDQSKVNQKNVAFYEAHKQQIAAQMSEGAK